MAKTHPVIGDKMNIDRNWKNEEIDKVEEVEEVEKVEEKPWSLQFAYTDQLRHDARRIAEEKQIPRGLCVIKTRMVKGRFPPMEVDIEAITSPTRYMRQLFTESTTPEQREEITQKLEL